MDVVLGIALSLHNSENNISPFLAYKFNLTDQFSIDIGAVSRYNSYSVLPMFKLNYDINQNFVFLLHWL
jgi:hypothetical protein